MKTKLSILLTAIVGGLISTMPAQAASLFSNEGIMFEQDTEVTFDFLQSNGYWKGSFGVVNLGNKAETILFEEDLNKDNGSGYADDNLGTPGNAVKSTMANFFFEADQEYSLFLRSFEGDEEKGIQYSTNSVNDPNNNAWYSQTYTIGDRKEEEGEAYRTNNFDSSLDGTIVSGRQRALFVGNLFEEGSANILFEDSMAGGDNDFDDFVVRATSESLGGGVLSESVPEPATLAGLGIVAGAMFLSRSHKKQK